jgi:hypothetical protein
MEFWLDKSKIAYTTKAIGTGSCAALDVWEENDLGVSPFRYTASFMSDIDARVYLTAKYPHAVENIVVEKRAIADEDVASGLSVPRPKPPHDLRDDDAGRKYREDSHRFRAEISRCLIPKHQKQETPTLSKVHGAGSDGTESVLHFKRAI